MTKDREKLKTLIKALVFLIVVIILPVTVFLTNKEFFMQFESIGEVEHFIEGYGHLSELVYIVFQIFQVVIFVIPGEVVQVAAGYLFGPFWGIIYALIGCAIGEAIAFGLARLLGQGFVRLFMSDEQFHKYHERLNSNKAYTLCFILYLIPGIPKDVLCYVAGVTEIDFLHFLGISMIARLPGLIGSIALGSLVDSGKYITAIIILAIAVVLCALGFFFRDHLQKYIDRIKESRKS